VGRMKGEHSMGTRRFDVSVASLVPWSLGSGGPVRAYQMAVDAGFNGLQLLPLRGWSMDSVRRLPNRGVIAWEGAWNYGSLWKVVQRVTGRAGEDHPLPIDWVVFGRDPMDPQIFGRCFQNALHVSHDSRERQSVYELHPEGGLPTTGLASLCWDTWHTRRPYRNGDPSPFQWKRLLEKWKDQIALIHVHPVGPEISSLLAGQTKGELQDMLRLLATQTKTQVSIVLEVAPTFGTRAQAVRYLSQLRQSIAEIMG